jgi:hypothetical protein
MTGMVMLVVGLFLCSLNGYIFGRGLSKLKHKEEMIELECRWRFVFEEACCMGNLDKNQRDEILETIGLKKEALHENRR